MHEFVFIYCARAHVQPTYAVRSGAGSHLLGVEGAGHLFQMSLCAMSKRMWQSSGVSKCLHLGGKILIVPLLNVQLLLNTVKSLAIRWGLVAVLFLGPSVAKLRCFKVLASERICTKKTVMGGQACFILASIPS